MLATDINSQAHSPKGTPSGHSPLRPVVSRRFQVLFTPLAGVLFTFPSRYSSLSVASVFSLGRWSSQLRTGFLVSRTTQDTSPCSRLRDSHPLWLTFPRHSTSRSGIEVLQPQRACTLVWAFPLSLATTRRILSFPRAT